MNALRLLAASPLLLLVTAPWTGAQRRPDTPYQCVTIRSGGGQGITCTAAAGPTVPLKSSVFIAADFAAACGGLPAVAVSPSASWLQALPADSAAGWIAVNASSSARSTLFCQSFQIPACSLQSATLQFWFAADDSLGDPSGPNQVGVYLNGMPVPGFSGGSYATQTYLVGGNVTGLLHAGTNFLQVYTRDLGSSVSGVMYSAQLCYLPCQAYERIRLRTGNGIVGGPDSQIRVVSGPAGNPIQTTPFIPVTDPIFAAACGGNAAQVVPPALGWCTAVSVDPLAKWVSTNQSLFAASSVYCQTFTVNSCSIQSATLDFRGSADDQLGDHTTPFNVGVYINGKPVPGSALNGAGGKLCDVTLAATITSLLIPNGLNTLHVYTRDTQFAASGLLYSALITIVPCGAAETITLRSGPATGITYLAGPAGVPLTGSPFTPADFLLAASGTPAVPVAPIGVWCQNLPSDPLAQWISTTSGYGPASALYHHPFTVKSCKNGIKSANLKISFCADDDLGDLPAWGPAPNPLGLYINGNSVPLSGPAGNYATSTSFSASIPPSWLSTGSGNGLYVYNRDKGSAYSGVLYSATLTIIPCGPFIIYGDGCGNPTFPNQSITSYPATGGTLDARILGAAARAPALTFAGISDSVWNGVPLPFDLALVGAPGCNLLASFDLELARVVTDSTGEATFTLPIPNDPSLVSATLFLQTVMLDGRSNALGISMSSGMAVTIQEPPVQ